MSVQHVPEPEYACDGKVRFTSRTAARGAKWVSEECSGGESFHIYLCPVCHAWHVGHALQLHRRQQRLFGLQRLRWKWGKLT